jgi:tetratricopeptide (TPR) repeat protein
MDLDHDQHATRAASLVWKARPIFLSSTFRDMHAERDYLREHGFARVAEKLRERCHYLSIIDLRQGVENVSDADGAKRELQVLKVCLDEIERSKPFLVAMLGDRYGWVPPAERMVAAARDAGLPDSVEVAGRSITELEILYAVLENPDQRKRSWFYLRTLDRTGMPPEVASRFPAEPPDDDPASPAGKLRALKKRIRREMPDRVREYTLRWDVTADKLVGLEEFDSQVAEDLWSDLNQETFEHQRQAPTTWQEADARSVTDFAAERTRSYVARPAVTEPMLAHAFSPATTGADWGLIVTGESGSGKSALFGSVLRALQPKAESGEIVLLAHAAGIFPMSGQVDRMLSRWVAELARHLELPNPLDQPGTPTESYLGDLHRPGGGTPITAKDIDRAFASLLEQTAGHRRVVLLVDALDQFEPSVRSSYLTWLPIIWPHNARFIATAIPGQATDTLEERVGCCALPVPPMMPDEAREFARRYYRERYHRDTNPSVVDTLIAKNVDATTLRIPAHGNPLWLALALHEMNLLEADDYERADREFADLPSAERLQALQLDEARKLPGDVPSLYAGLLDRAERGFGKVWADSFVDLIAVSRAGWRESDLRVLMPAVSGQAWDEVAFAGIRRALGTHVVQRGNQAQWDFTHAYLRDTVLKRNLADARVPIRLHGLIADHLQSLSFADPLHISETMYHLIRLGDQNRAADYLAEAYRQETAHAEYPAALSGAVDAIVDAICSAADDEDRDCLLNWIQGLLRGNEERIRLVACVMVRNVDTVLSAKSNAHTEVARFRLLQDARDALVDQAEYHAIPATSGNFSSGGYFLVSAFREETEKATFWLLSLWISHITISELFMSHGELNDSLESCKKSLALADKLARTYIDEMIWDDCLASSNSKIGDIALLMGDTDYALKHFYGSMAIAERITADDPSNKLWKYNLAGCYDRIGQCLIAKRDFSGAMNANKKSIIILRYLADSDRDNSVWQHSLAVSYLYMGDVHRDIGELDDALHAFKESLAITERLTMSDPSNALWEDELGTICERIGFVLLARSGSVEALKYYNRSLLAREHLVARNKSNTNWQRNLGVIHEKIGDVLLIDRDLSGALDAHTKGLEVRKYLADHEPHNMVWWRDLSVSLEKVGDAQQSDGQIDDALGSYRESFVIRKRLVEADPDNAVWQRDISVTYNKIGDMLLSQGYLSDSLTNYRESLLIRERLAEPNRDSAECLNDLAASQVRIGDALQSQDDINGALSSYRKALAIREKLAMVHPSNTEFRRELSVVYSRMEEVIGKVDMNERSESDRPSNILRTCKAVFRFAVWTVMVALLVWLPTISLWFLLISAPVLLINALALSIVLFSFLGKFSRTQPVEPKKDS